MNDLDNNNNDDFVDGDDDRKIAADAPSLVENGGVIDYEKILMDLRSGEGDVSLQNRFRMVVIHSPWTLENFTTDDIVAQVDDDGSTYILFAGTRNNDESWCPVEKQLGSHLETAVRDWSLVPSTSEVKAVRVVGSQRKYKRTLIRLFASTYSQKFFCKASDIVDIMSSNESFYIELKKTSKLRPSTAAKFDWKTDGLYTRLINSLDTLKAKAEDDDDDEEEEEDDDKEDALNEDDFDEPLAAFERIVSKFDVEPEAQEQIQSIRSLFVHLTHRADTNQEEMERLLRELQAYEGMENQTDEERLHALERRNNTLTEQNNAKRRKIDRLEQFLLSVAEHHPFSDSLWTDIFDFLGEGDADLKLRLQQKINESRRRFVFAAQSPSLDVDDSARGVYYRSTLHCVPGAPNTA